MIILIILGWLLFWYVVGGQAEYSVHRWLMHRTGKWRRRVPYLRAVFQEHAGRHHGKHLDQGLYLRPWVSVALVTAASLPLLFGAPIGLTTGVAVAGAHACSWNAIHAEIHFPQGRWFAATRWFCWLKAFHEQHHRDQKANFGAVFAPLPDLVWRTYRRANPMTHESWRGGARGSNSD